MRALLRTTACAVMCLFSGAALAQEAPTPDDPLATLDALPNDALAGQTVITGAANIAQSVQVLTATNAANNVNAETVVTGDVTLSPESFAGFSGIGNFLMNTGNNNNLQGSVSVVVVIPPP
jgi:hypothetical protein